MTSNRENLTQLLKLGIDTLNLKLSLATQEKIIGYIALLHKWNKTYNLTAIRDPKLILIRHIFDSLSVAKFIKGPNVLDFGTGAGLPGIPLALTLPQYDFVLLDSVNKKTTFLNHVVLSLNIKNVTIVTKRVETFSFAERFDTIITRATSTLDAIINYTKNLYTEKGQLLVMKGKYPTKELENVTKPKEIYRIKVPYLDEERHLIKILI